ncbi:MAG: LuxR C-terminal-related transcriptional regulator [Actinomycetota bacterium]|nr:LuxR C-terminal-related transcriptional regulator [Actinomycetota bacterium]
MLVTVVFLDVERSTELLVERGDVAGRAAVEGVLAVARERIEPYGGTEVKSLGDGLMLTFPAPRQAVTFAVTVQRALVGRSPALRVGINTGEIAGAPGDPVGEAVNAAARIAAKAAGGEVLVSDVVRQLVGTVPGVRFDDRGRSRLKGFSERRRLFAAAGTETEPDPVATFGRVTELDAIDAMLDAARSGTSGALVLEGEAGIGKTHLARAAHVRATAAGFAVVTAGADELEHDQPGRVVVGLASALGIPLDALLTDADHTGGTRGFALTEAVTNAIEDRAAATPVLVVVEDLQWADDLSVRGLATLSRRVRPLSVAILATLRPTPRPALVDQLLGVLRDTGAQHFRVSGLDATSVTAMTATLVGAPPGPRLAARLDGTAGNPLYVTEYLRVVDEEATLTVRGGIAEVDDDALPAGVRESVLRRLTSLSTASVEMLRLASLLGREFTLTDLATVAGRRVVEVAADLRPPVDAAVLSGAGETLSFRHDLVRDAVYDDIAPAIRRDLHAAAGRALATAGAPVLQVARQMELGARPGDSEAIEWLERAAHDTLRLDLASAVSLFERACALGPDTDTQIRLDTALLEPLAAVGRIDDARAIGRALLDGAVDARTGFVVRRGIAVASTVSGDLATAVADYAHAADAPGATPDDVAAVRCLEANIALLTGRAAAAVTAVAEQTLAHAARDAMHADELACIAHQTLALTAGAEARFEAGAEHARASRRLLFRDEIPTRGFLIPEVWEATFLLSMDAFDDAVAAYAAAANRAERRGELTLLVQTHTAVGFVHLLCGRWDDAVSEIEAGVAIADETGNRAHDIGCNAILAQIALARGDDTRAESALATADAALRAGRHLFGVELFACVVASKTAAEDPAAALALLRGAWTATEHLRGLVQYRTIGPALAGLAVSEGDATTARTVADEMARLADASGVASAFAAARRTDGLANNDADTLVDAVHQYRETPRRVDLAAACEEAARALLAADRQAEAVGLLEEAAALHVAFGAAHDLARVDASLRALGVSRRRRGPAAATHGWDALSPTERRVVDLVAQGLGNPRIASALYISRRTVETHVSHIFRKLAVTSRAQLAAVTVAQNLRHEVPVDGDRAGA